MAKPQPSLVQQEIAARTERDAPEYATCSEEGCGKPEKARGWCSMHYMRVLRTGSLELAPRKIIPPEERFWGKVNKTETCWLWTGPPSLCGGYGQFHVAPGLQVYSHRFAYELLVGPIPEGLVIDHLCRVPLCCNPLHLEPVTNHENIRRGESPAAIAVRLNRCIRGHEFTEANTYVTSYGFRQCIACRNNRNRARFSGRRAVA